MANSNIKIGLDFQVNSIQGMEKLKSSLQEISNMSMKDLSQINPTLNTEQLRTQINDINTAAFRTKEALEKAFNPQIKANKVKKSQIGKNSNNIGAIIEPPFPKVAFIPNATLLTGVGYSSRE